MNRTTTMSRVLLLWIAVAHSFVSAELILKQVQVISRDGAREPLKKDPITLKEEGSGAILNRGRRQLFNLGSWLGNRYGILLKRVHDPNFVRLESSRLERTMVSSSSLGLGLYGVPDDLSTTADPVSAALQYPFGIPVHTEKPRNDVTIRAFDKCPKLEVALAELYESSSWLGKEGEVLSLLQKLAEIPDFREYVVDGIVPLKNVLNVYDRIRVAKLVCVNTGDVFCQKHFENPGIATILSDELYQELEFIAAWAEFEKYGWRIAGRRVGGNLLRTILQRMVGVNKDQDLVNTLDEKQARENFRPFYHYSAHYPTLIGVISAMAQDSSTFLPQVGIPDNGAALVFELYQDDAASAGVNPLHVQVLYRDENGFRQVETPRICENITCPFDLFAAALETSAYDSPEDWCADCNNKVADVCLNKQLEDLSLPPQFNGDQIKVDPAKCEEQAEENERRARLGIAGGFFVGVITTILGCVAYYLFHWWRAERVAKRSGDFTTNDDDDDEDVRQDVDHMLSSTKSPPRSAFPRKRSGSGNSSSEGSMA